MTGIEQLHYSKPEVKREISRFARGRWVGVHCVKTDERGDRIMMRYLKSKPITISSPRDVDQLISRLRSYGLRSIYATAAKYSRILSVEDVKTISTMTSYTPTWDIDNDFEHWRVTVQSCMEMLNVLRDEGVKESVYVKWSGDGIHVHLHEGAISRRALRGRTPLDVAYAIVEYVKLKAEPRILELALLEGCSTIKVENKVDRQRMFTCPLSLHREHDRVCICIKPGDLSYFEPSWVNPASFKHYYDWDRYVEGEADSLAEKAVEVIGGFPPRRYYRRKHPKLDQAIKKWLSLT